MSITNWEEFRKGILEILKPRNLIYYTVIILLFGAVSFILPYDVQVYSSIISGIVVAILLFSSLAAIRGFTKLDIVFIGGIIFLIIALFPRGLLIFLFSTQDIMRDFEHLFRILSISLTVLYFIAKFKISRIKPHDEHIKHLSDFFSICNTTISSELCSCLHPIPFLDALLVPLGIAGLLLNRVKLGFVIMMITLIFQIRTSYVFNKCKSKKNNKIECLD